MNIISRCTQDIVRLNLILGFSKNCVISFSLIYIICVYGETCENNKKIVAAEKVYNHSMTASFLITIPIAKVLYSCNNRNILRFSEL